MVLPTCMTQRHTGLLKCAPHWWQGAEVKIPCSSVILVRQSGYHLLRKMSDISEMVLTFNISSIFGHRDGNLHHFLSFDSSFVVIQRTSGRVLKLKRWCPLSHEDNTSVGYMYADAFSKIHSSLSESQLTWNLSYTDKGTLA